MDKETEDRVNQPVPFMEFPKMLYHPDGRTLIVEDDSEQSAAGSEWAPNPEAAQKARAQRDTADASRSARRVGADAAARNAAPER